MLTIKKKKMNAHYSDPSVLGLQKLLCWGRHSYKTDGGSESLGEALSWEDNSYHLYISLSVYMFFN